MDDNDIPLLDRSLSPAYRRASSSVATRREPLPLTANVAHLQLPSLGVPTKWRPSSHNYSYLDDEHVPQALDQTPVVHNTGNKSWLPYTLRWPFLLGLLVFAIVLLISITTLQVQSHKHQGLGNDNERSTILFACWKFIPTLVALVFALMSTMLLDDVKRTEPYARLAREGGGPGHATVLQRSEAWWNTLADGFRKDKNNGGYSWPLILSTCCLFLALFVISPLSAALLVSDHIWISQDTRFGRMTFRNDTAISVGDQVEPRFRTISSLISNVVTSSCITDDFMAMPVEVFDRLPAPYKMSWEPESRAPEALWHTETAILRSELSCQPMLLKSKSQFNITDRFNSTTKYVSLELEGAGGCIIRSIAVQYSQMATHGGALWLPRNVIRTGLDIGSWTSSPKEPVILRASKECVADEFLLATTAWLNDDIRTWTSNLQVNSQACSSTIYQGVVPITRDFNRQVPTLVFSEDLFNGHKAGLDHHLQIQDQFNSAFFSPNWTFHFHGTYAGSGSSIGIPLVEAVGPSSPLLASYGFSTTAACRDKSIDRRMARIKQRYLGEMLYVSLVREAVQPAVEVPGTTSHGVKRILVTPAIAIVLEVVVLIEAVLLCALWLTTRTRKRPLGITTDPAQTVTVAALIAKNIESRTLFKHLGNVPPATVSNELKHVMFRTHSQELWSVRDANEYLELDVKRPKDSSADQDLTKHPLSETQGSFNPRSWRPFILYKLTITGLALVLVAVLSAASTLLAISRGPGLYQKGFVYSAEVVVFSRHLSTIAPSSIIPTLVAVGIGAWWTAMKTELRLLQPFIAMSKVPVKIREGVALSYQTSYSVWASWRAFKQGHWLLSLVCAGAIFSQIFTIAMSALWQQDYGVLTSKMTVKRSLEIRTMPLLSTVTQELGFDFAGLVNKKVLDNTFADFRTNWLYNAIIRTNLRGDSPPWTTDDGWNYAPVDLSAITRAGLTANDTNTWADSGPYRQQPSTSDVVVNVTTSSLIASLDCTPYSLFSNHSNWLMTHDFTNTSRWNATTVPTDLKTGYIVGLKVPGGIVGEMITIQNALNGSRTSILGDIARPRCCDNLTADVYGQSMLAYWSLNYDDTGCFPYCYSTSRDNFTVKFIRGRPVAGVMFAKDSGLELGEPRDQQLAWYEVPQIAALNCKPRFQRATASLVVDPHSGKIEPLTVTHGEVHDDESAWSDGFVIQTTANRYNNYTNNITTSYGYLFMNALLHASAQHTTYFSRQRQSNIEKDVEDMTFAFKQPGMNMDYMSYAMYSRTNLLEGGQADTTLLNHDLLYKYANETFTAFFQSFVNSNLSLTNGGWTYQPIGQTEPMHLGAVDPNANSTRPTMEVEIRKRVKMLRMSPIAAWLSISVLLWLIATTIAILITENQYLDKIIRGVSSLADVAILVAGSHAFLQYVQEQNQNQNRDNSRSTHEDMKTNFTTGKTVGTTTRRVSPCDTDDEPKTKLGWFRDRDGQKRWGIELFGPGYGVQWLDEREGREDIAAHGFAD